MRSPFPGMDPYLESHWLDVHPRLVVESSNRIQRQLGDDLVTRIEERLVVEDPVGPTRRIGPDLRIVEYGQAGEPVRPAGGAMVAEPITLYAEADPIRQRSIEILDASTGGRVVTVIEFVSPTNKLPGDGREKYARKQLECRDGDINLVEVDLTRAGRRQLLIHRWAGARQYESAYQVSIWRAAWPSRCDVIPIRLQDALPAIAVPLRPTDSEAVLDLQAIVDAVYEFARYDRTTDYERECEPPLCDEEAAWAGELLQKAGKRRGP